MMSTENESAQATPNADAQQNSNAAPEKAPEGAKQVEQAVEQKTEDQKPAEQQAEQPKAPEKYDLKLSEKSPISKERIAELEQYAKEKGLSQDAAQELVSREEKVLSDFAQKQQDFLKSETQRWAESVKADPEIGGEHFAETSENAKRALERFGSQALKDALNSTGLGNHPELVRAFSKIGKAMSEDKIVRANSHYSEKESATDILFPSMKKQN